MENQKISSSVYQLDPKLLKKNVLSFFDWSIISEKRNTNTFQDTYESRTNVLNYT